MTEVDQLLNESDDQLLLLLGATSIALSSEPSLLNRGEVGVSGGVARMLGEDEPDFLRTTGIKILKRLSSKLHTVVCKQANAEAQISLKAALVDKKSALAAAFLALLVKIGITSTIAMIAATILANALFEATYETLCDQWIKYNHSIGA